MGGLRGTTERINPVYFYLHVISLVVFWVDYAVNPSQSRALGSAPSSDTSLRKAAASRTAVKGRLKGGARAGQGWGKGGGRAGQGSALTVERPCRGRQSPRGGAASDRPCLPRCRRKRPAGLYKAGEARGPDAVGAGAVRTQGKGSENTRQRQREHKAKAVRTRGTGSVAPASSRTVPACPPAAARCIGVTPTSDP